MNKAKVLKYITDRIEAHEAAIDNIEEVDVTKEMKKGKENALVAMGKMFVTKEQEHLHKGALLELNEIKTFLEGL